MATPLKEGFTRPIIHANGCIPSFVSSTELSVSAGSIRNTNNYHDINLNAPVSLFQTLSGAGGLDTGAFANNTLYALYVIGSSQNRASSSVIASLSEVTPLLPTYYDMYQKIGHIRTDGSAQFLNFVCIGNGLIREFYYDVNISVTTANDVAFTSVDASNIIPAYATKVFLFASILPAVGGDALYFRTPGFSGVDGNAAISGSVAAVSKIGYVSIVSAPDATFEYKVDNAGDATDVRVSGFQEIIGL